MYMPSRIEKQKGGYMAELRNQTQKKYLLKFYVFMLMYIFMALFILYLTFRFSFGYLSSGNSFSYRFTNAEFPENESFIVIIDAGHGGIDSGAVGIDDILEKNINLTISKKLEKLLNIANIEVIMTRTEDIMLDSDGATKRKASDLANRIRIVQKYPSALFISIHMNKFPQEKYKGLQVFYSVNNLGSANLADIIKKNNKKYLQPDNNREIKRGKDIFILEKTNNCAVLIECGFLSNHEEARLLNSEEYQNKLSRILFISILQYLGEENNKFIQ